MLILLTILLGRLMDFRNSFYSPNSLKNSSNTQLIETLSLYVILLLRHFICGHLTLSRKSQTASSIDMKLEGFSLGITHCLRNFIQQPYKSTQNV